MLATIVLALVTAAAAPQPGAPPPAEAGVREAIVRAVRERVGDAAVTVEGLRIRGDVAGVALRATPDPGSRAGGPIRFVLRATAPDGRGRVRVGSADAVVRLRLPHARATTALRAGAIITAGDVVTVDDDPGRVPLRRLARGDALAGARLRRRLTAGAAIPGDAVTPPPLVRRGDEVVTTIRVGAVAASGRAIALDDGVLDAAVRVQVDGRRLRSRVRGAGEVEITP